MSTYNQLAADIIANVGGKDNIKSLRHCITRLRFQLKDESKANDSYLKNREGIITTLSAAGEYMAVIGEHVPDVFNEVSRQLGREAE
ncbi:PTS transporter subunit EIIB [Streptococcus sp. S784/96/1]|uniref:PTS transporter subunit EIIB n=1 Tax=Streptococcus sp. S784/96/1 TaxID=2653499 RepID=UPI00192E54D2|nr:PTS transporter subunit EIIB [Streptococcus sp. S784/96/1]